MLNTSVRAAAEGMPAINRRRLLIGTTVTAAALAASSLPAEPAGSSPILALLRKWEAVRSSIPSGVEDDELERLCDIMGNIEAQMMAIPATTAVDLAVKLLVATGFGDYYVEDNSPVMAEALALVRGLS